MGTRHQDHDPLIPGPGQKVEYHSHHYYDGWDGVPDTYKANGWVLINHTSYSNGNYTDYSFQRLVEDTPVTEQPEDRHIEDRPTNGQAERVEQGARVEIAELRAQIKALQDKQSTALVAVAPPVDQAAPVMTIQMLEDRDVFIQNIVDNFFKKGIHVGEPFPDAKDKNGKPILMLYKAGAEWFGSAFGVRPDYTPLDAIVETGEQPRVFYRYRCDLVSIRTGQIVGQAEGLCSSDEEKYKYQQAKYKCPSCGKDAIIKDNYAKDDKKEGWVCYRKGGGCGAKYAKGAVEIVNQPKPGRSLNVEVLDKAHTILAMAQKRAFVLALRAAFGLDAYIKYYEGVDEPEEHNGSVVDSTATVKDDVPPKVKKFNDQVRKENGDGDHKPAPESTPESAESGQEPDTPAPKSELDEYLGPRNRHASDEPGDEHDPERVTPPAAQDSDDAFGTAQRKQYHLSIDNMLEHGTYTKEDFCSAFHLDKFDDHLVLEQARTVGGAVNIGLALTWIRKQLKAYKAAQVSA